MILLTILGLSFAGAVLYALRLRHVVRRAPQLQRLPAAEGVLPKTIVVIPAYNEAQNIADCLNAVLDSSDRSAEQLEIWLIDDQSTDETWQIAQQVKTQRQDPRLKLLAGKPRPVGERWVGKNWACTQAAEQVAGEFLLFLDADVRLKPGAIETVVQTAEREKIDLLSCGPAIECGCLSEWLVQPLIIGTILLGFPFDAVNDPAQETAFAAGPFMLFRRSAYAQIGGHRAVAGEIVEDVELGRRIKRSGLRLYYSLASDLVSVRMYRDWQSLWEGWTKNLYLGSQRNLRGMLVFASSLLLICTVPWIGLIISLVNLAIGQINWLNELALLLSVLTILLHYDLRRVGGQVSQIAPRYWWLTGLGGAVTATIALASIVKTETGWGWTWRGRSLKVSL